jgi:preprotein translocase subunit YajC
MMMRFIALILLLAQQSLLARDAAVTDPQGQTTLVRNPTADGIKSMLLMGVFVVGMWFLLIQPQRKKAKELETTQKALKPGDKIVTSSGILGVVLNIKDKSLSIRSAETKLEIERSSVLRVLERVGEPSESKS